MKAFGLDPRTKILLLLMISAFILGGVGGSRMWICNIILCLIPLFLNLIHKKWVVSLVYIVLYVIGLLMQQMMNSVSLGMFHFVFLTCTTIFIRLLPGIMMGRYALSTTKVSEFIAAMEKMHISSQITIPLSVLFRFFPTIMEEGTAINSAMKMRGVRIGGGKAFGMLEYRLIPMITCSVKIGEELSAAALTRGLGGPAKRTNVCRIGFRLADYVIMALCAGILAYWLAGYWKG